MREKLASLRNEQGFTQEEIANIVGISRSFYGLIETGVRNPTYGLAQRIAKVVGANVEDLFFDLDGFRMKRVANDENEKLILTGTD